MRRKGAVRGLTFTFALFGALSLPNCGGDPLGVDGGRLRWRVPGAGAVTPSADSQTVFFGSTAHDLVAVDARTGAVRWTAKTQAGGPRTEGRNTVVAGEVVAVGDVSVYAYRRSDGAARWVYQPTSGDWPGVFNLATDGMAIYAGSENGRAYAIDATTGAARWVRILASDGNSKALNPTVHNGRVYYGVRHYTSPFTGRFVALDAQTGEEIWSHAFEPELPQQDAGCFGGAAIHGDHVIVAADDGRVYSFDQATGAIRWTAPRLTGLPGNLDPTLGDSRPVVVAGSVVLVGSATGYLVALDAASGSELWRRSPSLGSAILPLAADSERGYVVHLGGQLTVVDVRTGQLLWRTDALFVSSPLVRDSSVYLGGIGGYYALRR
jgi:outer membrane protein assembly factor BamB